MHAKLNVIKLFNRLSLLANQTLSSPVKVSHTQNSNRNKIVASDVKADDTDYEKTDVANNNLANDKASRKFIMSSSLQLYEDDLSRIDVKSLVSDVIIIALISWDMFLEHFLCFFRIFLNSFRQHHIEWRR